jgi:TolB protein
VRGATVGILAAAAISLAAAAPAQATFPGENGEVAFTRYDGDHYRSADDLLIANPNGSNERFIVNSGSGGLIGDPTWSGDGRRLAWSAGHHIVPGAIHVANPDRTDERVVGGPATYEPALSPDGRRVAYVRYARGRGGEAPGLYVTDLDSGATTALGEYMDPDWSPDGTTIAAVEGTREASAEGADLFAVPVNGGPAQRLTDTAEVEIHPSWSPDGRSIVYARALPDQVIEIWVVDADGSNARRLALGNEPVWSPDGSKIMYEGGTGISTGVWVMDADGANARLLIPDAESPAWRPASEPAPIDRANESPDCAGVVVSRTRLPARGDGQFRRARFSVPADPDGDVIEFEIARIGQDEPVRDRNGFRAPDAHLTKRPTVVLLRDQRARRGDGRVYTIDFSITDPFGARCDGTAKVGVPRRRGRAAIESPFYVNSLRRR